MEMHETSKEEIIDKRKNHGLDFWEYVHLEHQLNKKRQRRKLEKNNEEKQEENQEWTILLETEREYQNEETGQSKIPFVMEREREVRIRKSHLI